MRVQVTIFFYNFLPSLSILVRVYELTYNNILNDKMSSENSALFGISN